MKKLMFAVAALAAGATFAEITSANVVGYTTTETPDSGNAMIGGSFVSVSADGSFKLGDLSMQGYDPEEGAWGEACIKILNAAGNTAKDAEGMPLVFSWKDYEDEEVVKGWFNDDDEQWSNDYTFDAGQGFWVQGEGYSLVCAGAVKFDAVSVATPSSGNAAIANPYPIAITLADISMSGYDPEEGAWGEACLKILNAAGNTAKNDEGMPLTFSWKDYEDEEVVVGWFNDDDEQWDDATSFPIGQGFWVQGEGYTVNFTFPAAK